MILGILLILLMLLAPGGIVGLWKTTKAKRAARRAAERAVGTASEGGAGTVTRDPAVGQ